MLLCLRILMLLNTCALDLLPLFCCNSYFSVAHVICLELLISSYIRHVSHVCITRCNPFPSLTNEELNVTIRLCLNSNLLSLNLGQRVMSGHPAVEALVGKVAYCVPSHDWFKVLRTVIMKSFVRNIFPIRKIFNVLLLKFV